MAALNADLTVEQGSTFVLEFQVFNDLLDAVSLLTSSVNDDGTLTYSLDKYRARMKIKKSKYRTPVLYSCGTTMNYVVQPGSTAGFVTDGIFFIGGATGFMRIVITANTSEDFKGGRYFYDLEFVEMAGSSEIVSKLLDGKFEVEAEATKT